MDFHVLLGIERYITNNEKGVKKKKIVFLIKNAHFNLT